MFLSSRLLKIIGVVAVVVVIVVVAVLLTGGGDSPAEVAVAFYRAGNEGSYTKAYNYLAPQTRMAWEMMGAFVPRFDNAMDNATQGGSITRIEVQDTIEYGGMHATVRVTLDYRASSPEQDVLTLTKVDGQWKIFSSTLLVTP